MGDTEERVVEALDSKRPDEQTQRAKLITSIKGCSQGVGFETCAVHLKFQCLARPGQK